MKSRSPEWFSGSDEGKVIFVVVDGKNVADVKGVLWVVDVKEAMESMWLTTMTEFLPKITSMVQPKIVCYF